MTINEIHSEKENNLDFISMENKVGDHFFEIAPLKENINFEEQKELTTKPLAEIELPNLIFLVVDKETELKPTLLREYPEWSFLPEEELNNYSIQIFSDQNKAKLNCSKNQKILKVPNPKVIFLVSNILKNKGINRIIFGESIYII